MEIQTDLKKENIELELINVNENSNIKLINNKTEEIKIPVGDYEKQYRLKIKLKDFR